MSDHNIARTTFLEESKGYDSKAAWSMTGYTKAPAPENKLPLVDRANPKDVAGSKKARLDLVPPALAIGAAPVMALGARKYGPYNWRTTPVKLSVYLTAIIRHAYAALDGQYLDPESGEPHVAHIAAGAGIVLDASAYGTLIDDLDGVRGPAAELLARQANDA